MDLVTRPTSSREVQQNIDMESYRIPKMQIVHGKTVCVVSCQRSPEPVFLKWKGMEASPEGDFFVRSGPGTVRLSPDSATEYVRTRFGQVPPTPSP